MANAIVSYLKEEQTLVEDVNGIQLNEAYIVTNLAPGRNMLYDALFAAGVPNYNDPHPTIPNLFCIKKIPKVFARTSNTESKVICTFGPSDFSNAISPIIRYHGYTVESETNFDINGNPITVNYTDYSDGSTPFPAQIGLVRGTKERGLLTVELISETDPTFYTAYENCLNAVPWRGKNALTWLCCSVDIDKVLYRPGWHVGLSFDYDSETHIHTAAYRLLGGIIPKDIDSVPVPKTVGTGNGWTNAQTNFTANFNSLPIPGGFG